jgi:glycosyltransferase involved in cell wall biosynthesis
MLLKLLERIDRRRFLPHVISLTSLGEIGPRIEALGISVECLGMKAGIPNPLVLFRLAWRLRSIRPNVVHTWMHHADLLGGLAARMAGVKAIAWGIRSSNLDVNMTKWSTRVVVRLCALLSAWLPKRILCNSEGGRQVHVMVGYDKRKMVVVPNGFDLVRFKPDESARVAVRAELGLPKETPLVGLLGRYDVQKNQGGFIEAAGLLRERRPDVHFVLAGLDVDWDNESLLSAAKSAGVLNAIHLLGLRDDVPRLIASFDVLASSSHGEGFPNVLGEAMACGVPCAVTDVGDSAYIVGDTGQVVASGDMVGLAKAIGSLLELPTDKKRDAGYRARRRIEDYFEIGRVVGKYENIYDQLAGQVD